MTFLLPTAYSIMHRGHDTISMTSAWHVQRLADEQSSSIGMCWCTGLREDRDCAKYLQLSSMNILRTGTSTCSNLINKCNLHFYFEISVFFCLESCVGILIAKLM